MRIIVAVGVSLVFLIAHPQMSAMESGGEGAREQTSFCDTGDPDARLNPVLLPKIVLTTIMNTKEGKEARELASRKGNKIVPEELLEGTTVHLSNSHGLFFLVMGSSPMSGADNTWFWILQYSRNRAYILLFASANCLEVNHMTRFGYKNVVTTWSSPSETVINTYRYDGQSYKLWKTRSQPK